MKLDVAKYRSHQEGLLKMVLNNPEKDIERAIGMIAVATHTPVTAIAIMYNEVYGPKPEVELMIEKLTKFYGYVEILK